MKMKSTYRETYKTGVGAHAQLLDEWAAANKLPPPFDGTRKARQIDIKSGGIAVGEDGKEYEFVNMTVYVRRFPSNG